MSTKQENPRQTALEAWSNPDIVDETSNESFPASDPPSWTPLQRSGPPPLIPRGGTCYLPASDRTQGPEPFSAEEWAEITDENRQGAKSIVGIMVTIFLIGLAIYGSISLWIVLAT